MRIISLISILMLAAATGLAQDAAAPRMDAEGYSSVEEIPETAITNLPFTITESGYYYLATNLLLLAPGVDGITIRADKVGIDCLGFSLLGPGAGSGHGITQDPTNRYCMVANAALSMWLGDGKYAVHMAGGGNRVQNVRAARNSKGIFCGDSSTIASCVVQSGGSDKTACGIYAYAESEVADCEVSDIEGGLYAYGIRVESNSLVHGCTVRDIRSGGTCYGIHAGEASRVTDCEVTSCRGADEASSGIRVQARSVIEESVAAGNSHRGLWLSDVSRAENNTSERNGTIGLLADGPDNRIEHNTVVSNACGLRVTGSGNTIIRNKASGNGIAYDGLAITGNIWGVISATPTNDPKANLEF